MLFSLGQVGEGGVCFSLGQVLGLLCNPRNLLKKHHSFPAGRPADAWESHVRICTHIFWNSGCMAV